VFTCGDARYAIGVRGGTGPLEVSVDGQTFRLDVREVAPGRFRLVDGERAEAFECVRDGDNVHVFWRGLAYALQEESETRRSAHRHAPGGLEAPMPGKVIKVNVEPGQLVARGAEILVIEAMKMENAIRAPRDGRVKSVAARVGETVSPGVVLVELE
jgi:3-methylcrotonyl-CoA carboxylase alpha subunit